MVPTISGRASGAWYARRTWRSISPPFATRSRRSTRAAATIERFSDYRQKRNTTSHTYNQQKAEAIVAVLNDFAADMHALLAELERRNREEAD